MKELTLIRHAKSSWDHPELSDFDRPLNRRGLENAAGMGRWLAQSDFAPDLLLTSTAVRALETARILADALELPTGRILQEEALYHAEREVLLDLLKRADNRIGHLALIGHNPGLTALANELGTEFLDNLPTCGVLTLSFDTPAWSSVITMKGQRVRYDFPKRITS